MQFTNAAVGATKLGIFCAFFILFLVPTTKGGCSINVHKDVTDINLEGKGACIGKKLTISLSNEYRAYCTGTCFSKHEAYVPESSKISLKACVPLPTDGEYDVVRHLNYNATCDSGTKWELIDFEYVNATHCKCRKVVEKYISTSYSGN